MEHKQVYYRRYMDDIIVLAESRMALKRAIRCVNQHFAMNKVTQHPDKTQIGRTCRGIDFLGYEFKNGVLTTSKRTELNHLRRLLRLYQQKKHLPNCQMLLDNYRRRWCQWIYSGLLAVMYFPLATSTANNQPH